MCVSIGNDMDTTLAITGYIAGVFGFIATLVAGVVVVRSSAIKQTIKIQDGLITALSKEVEVLKQGNLDNQKRILDLEKEVEVFKTLPLAELVKTMIAVNEDTKKIIKILEVDG